MSPLIALLTLGSLQAPSKDAMEMGTRVLAAFDIAGPYLRRFSNQTQEYQPKTVSLLVLAKDGVGYGFHADRLAQRFLSVQRGDVPWSPASAPRPRREIASSLQRAKVQRAILRLKLPNAVLPLKFQAEGPSDQIVAPVAVDGYPFIDSRTYDYYFRLDAATGAFQEFHNPRPTPELDRAVPKLTADEALLAARKALVDDKRKTTYWTEYQVPASKIDAGPKLRLGWYVPYEEKRARLIWEVPYVSVHHSSSDQKPSSYTQTLYIDAVKGTHIPPPPGRL